MHGPVSAGATGHPVGEFVGTARLSYPPRRARRPKSKKMFERSLSVDSVGVGCGG